MKIFRKSTSRYFIILTLVMIGLACWQWRYIDAFAGAMSARVSKPASVQQRIEQYGSDVRARLEPLLQKASLSYPPARLTFIALKEEKLLEVWAGNATGPMHRIKVYPIKAASGVAGPKLREGDRQVPEGIYAIELINPNSSYHLSLRVGYPNAFDKARAKEEGRPQLGGDIMIHGKAVSLGCLAMGDEAAEDLFVLAGLTDLKNIQVILCPCDLRTRNFPPPSGTPKWTGTVYEELKKALADYPAQK